MFTSVNSEITECIYYCKQFITGENARSDPIKKLLRRKNAKILIINANFYYCKPVLLHFLD